MVCFGIKYHKNKNTSKNEDMEVLRQNGENLLFHGKEKNQRNVEKTNDHFFDLKKT